MRAFLEAKLWILWHCVLSQLMLSERGFMFMVPWDDGQGLWSSVKVAEAVVQASGAIDYRSIEDEYGSYISEAMLTECKLFYSQEMEHFLRKLLWLTLLSSIVVGYFTYSISKNLKTNRNDVSISMNDPDVEPASLSIAVVGDIHLPEGREPLTKFRERLWR